MTTKQLLGPNQEKWLKVLESDRYKQVQNFLSIPNKGNCCLGVACRIFLGKPTGINVVDDELNVYHWDSEDTNAPDAVVKKLAIYDREGSNSKGCFDRALTALNDSGHSFKQIAAIIRENPGEYFSEPR